jgi:ESCRT-I complex subunit TSG101
MVHDPRVTALLSRLGGLYRDPARVDRDASSLLKSSVGVHLVPGIAPLVENNGDSSHCLVLQGTIAIVFRGTTYQLLADMYLPPGYPIRPPVAYVRLAPNMYLKENHPHVGSDGMVYLPYTHEWNSRTHSLIEMVVAMSSVFSAEPPVFTRTTPAPAPAAASPPPPPSYQGSSSTTYRSPTDDYISSSSNSNAQQDMESERYMEEQIALIQAQEASEKQLAIESARTAEEDRQQQIAAQKQWEGKKTLETRQALNQQIHSHLTKLADQTKAGVQSDWRDQQQLNAAKEAIVKEMEQLEAAKAKLTEAIATVDFKTEEITEWLQEADESKEEAVEVDDICQPVTKLHAQMLDQSSENATLTDALYFLDRSMYMGHIDCTTHLKAVRKLAKQQFLIRAHLIKINQVLLKQNS